MATQTFTQLRAMVGKDLLLTFTDRKAWLLNLVAPIILAAFMGYIFGGSGKKSEPTKIPIAVVDQDNSALSTQVVQSVGADKTLNVKTLTVDEAREQVQKGKIRVAVIIPSGFGENASQAFFSGRDKPELSLLYDPSQTAVLGMVQGILTQHVMQIVSKEMFSGKGGQQALNKSLSELDRYTGLSATAKDDLRSLLQSVQNWQRHSETAEQTGSPPGLSMPYTVREEAIASGKRSYNGYAHAFAGMGVQFILFMGIEAGVLILLQRRQGLWKRLRAAPLSKATLLGSRIVSSALIAIFLLAVMYTLAWLIFDVRIEGSVLGFAAVVLAFALMNAAFGLMIAALGDSPDATRGISIFAVLIMVMIGGAWVPSFLFPTWLQDLSLLVPTRWAVDGLEAMTWRGLDFTAALGPIFALLGFAVLFSLLAVYRFRWESDR